MAKLTDDMLRFIINLDASGAQGEINTLTASISELEKENKSLAAANRETEKEIKTLERQLAALEKQGKQNTAQYQNLSKQLTASRQSVADFNTTIQQNTDKIRQNQQQQQALLKSLKLEDMTMNQLRDRARQLQTQLNNTSKSANPEAYQKLSQELEQTQKRMGELGQKQRTIGEQFTQMPGTLGKISNSVANVGKKLKTLVATNPLILALAGAIELLRKYIQGSDTAATQFAGAMAVVNSVLDSTNRILAQVGGMLSDFFTGNWSNLKNRAMEIKETIIDVADSARQAFQGALNEDELQDQMRHTSALIKVNQAEIGRLREIADDATRSAQERSAALQKMINLEKENFQSQLQDAGNAFFKVWEGKEANVVKAFKSTNAELFKQVEDGMHVLERGGNLTYQQQRKLVDATNRLIAETDTVSEDKKDEFQKYVDDMISLQTQFYSSTRAYNRRLSSLRKELNKEDKKDTEDLIKQQEQLYKEDLKNAEEYNKEQLLNLKNQYANRQITEQQFTERSQQELLRYYETLRALQEQYGESTVDTETRIADLRLQINQRVDKQIEEQRKKSQKDLKKQADDTIKIIETLHQTADTISRTLGDTLGAELMQNLSTATQGIQKMMQTINSDTATMGQKVSESVTAIATTVSAAMNSVSQITKAAFELETNTLEAEKQKQLTIAGDNAAEREKIERDYAEKELELKKKQADADAAVSSSKLWINTAMGIATAWATSMELGPIAGPIVAAVLTASLLATAGVEQANILKQRNIIRNTSLDSSSTGTTSAAAPKTSSTTTTNNYTLKKQYAGTTGTTGAAGTSGYAQGGYTGDGELLEPAGIVHRGEYVIPAAELRNPTVIPMVRRIDGIRTRRLATQHAAATQGFADGGFTGNGNENNNYQLSTINYQLTNSLARLNQLLAALEQHPIRAEVNYRELAAARQTMEKIKKI